MNLDLPDNAFAFLNLEPWSIAIIIPLLGLIFAGVVVVTTMYFKNRQREMWHQTARLALEKGQPLPALPADDTPARQRRDEGDNDLRDGLICIGVGIGLYIFLGSFLGRGLGYVGAIPGFIGVAMLLHALIAALAKRKKQDSDTLPPRS